MKDKDRLSDKQIADYFRRSFTAVDGLWFMKVEEKLGFAAALEIDKEVWKVVPKIQIRELKKLLDAENGLNALMRCLETDLSAKGFQFSVREKEGVVDFVIRRCPWHETMVKSGREQLSTKVGDVICRTEYSTWADEFNDDIRFELTERICNGAATCVLSFMKKNAGKN